MTANPVPTLVLPDPQGQSRPQDNNNAIIRYTKTISPRMYVADGYLVSFNGAPPPVPPSDAYNLIAGVQSVLFNLGNGQLVFPEAIPNGILSWVGIVDAAGGQYFVQYDSAIAATPTTLDLSLGPSDPSVTVTVSYQMIVW